MNTLDVLNLNNYYSNMLVIIFKYVCNFLFHANKLICSFFFICFKSLLKVKFFVIVILCTFFFSQLLFDNVYLTYELKLLVNSFQSFLSVYLKFRKIQLFKSIVFIFFWLSIKTFLFTVSKNTLGQRYKCISFAWHFKNKNYDQNFFN